MLKYFQRKRKRKLLRQWVERAGLPPEAIPQEEVAEDMMPSEGKEQSRLNILSILLGISLVIVCVGLFFLIAYSC